MSITKAVDACKDRLYDAQERLSELEAALKECNRISKSWKRISKSWKAQWENVLHENALLKKDNAYLLEQLPVQKKQQYDSGMKFTTKEYQERISKLEAALLEAVVMFRDAKEELYQCLTVHAEYSNRMELKLSELEEALKK